MSDTERRAHSLAEAQLYVLITPCPRCGEGPVRAAGGEPIEPLGEHTSLVNVVGTCEACGRTSRGEFRITMDPANAGGSSNINPTDEPSRIIDVGQWITLSSMLTVSAEHGSDATRARRLRLEAGDCITEALRFYTDEENELPPESALFTDKSREFFRNSPALFMRSRLVALRARLPHHHVGGR